MSVWFALNVGTSRKGSMEILRITNTGRLLERPRDDDVVSTYRVILDETDMGTLRHRYGDGAWVLARNALDLAVSPPGQMGGRAAARRLGVHESTVKNYANRTDAQGRALLPFTRTPGGHRRYKGADVDAIRPLIRAQGRRGPG